MFEKFTNFFNKEAKDESPEADKLTGRTAEDVVDDISERQEHFTSPEGREEKMHGGVEQIMDEFRIPAEQLMGEQEFVALKLREKGFVTTQDEAMTGFDGILKETLRTVARERMEMRGKKQG